MRPGTDFAAVLSANGLLILLLACFPARWSIFASGF
jgi:hypothetical protein